MKSSMKSFMSHVAGCMLHIAVELLEAYSKVIRIAHMEAVVDQALRLPLCNSSELMSHRHAHFVSSCGARSRQLCF